MKKKSAILAFILLISLIMVILTTFLYWVFFQPHVPHILLSEDLTQEANVKLRESFIFYNFGIYPSDYTLKAGRGLKLLAGVKNIAGDAKEHSFVINIIPAQVNENAKSWISFQKSAINVDVLKFGFFPIELDIPADAEERTYIFTVSSCYDKDDNPPVSEECLPESDNVWESPEHLRITVSK